jgi:hypothetical protein
VMLHVMSPSPMSAKLLNKQSKIVVNIFIWLDCGPFGFRRFPKGFTADRFKKGIGLIPGCAMSRIKRSQKSFVLYESFNTLTEWTVPASA